MDNEVSMLLADNLYEDILNVVKSDVDFSKFKNKTVLINGAHELLGFYLACALLVSNDLNGTNIKVVAVGKDDSIFKLYGKLTSRNDIDFIVSESFSNINTEADFLIQADKLSCEAEILNILNYIKTHKSISLINSHSDIYGDVFNGKDTISEKDMGYLDCCKPSDYYASLERMAESAAITAVKEYSLDIKLSRMCQVFGFMKYGQKSGYINIFKSVIDKKDIEIENKDRELCSYIYVTDATEAILKILTEGKSAEIYNVSSQYISSNHIFAQYCVKLFEDLDIKIIYKGKTKTLSPMAPTLEALDASKLKALGVFPKVDIQNGIIKSVKNLYELRG